MPKSIFDEASLVMTATAESLEISYKFAGFVSYSHAADSRTGQVMESTLERFLNVWYRKRRRRIYLDRGDLSANADLWGPIQRALAESKFLILLASPESAASPWEIREITWWLEHRSLEELIIVKTKGTIEFDEVTGAVELKRSDALPKVLLDVLDHEPLWVTFPSPAIAGKLDATDPEWDLALAAIVAPLDGREKDELVGEHVRNRSRALRLRIIIIPDRHDHAEDAAPNAQPSWLSSVKIEPKTIIVEESWYRDSNPDCCPSGKAVTTWTMSQGTFTASPTRVTG